MNPCHAVPRPCNGPAALARVLLAIGAPFMAACDPGSAEAERDAPPFAARDSAGIRIIESGAPLWGEDRGWRVDPEAVVEIGALDGAEPYLFKEIASATRASDGRLVLVEGGTREIRVFDAAGNHLVSFGGEGEGPGEFDAAPDILVTPGDTLVAFDEGLFRHSWFTLDGELVRDAAFPRETAEQNLRDVFSIERVLLATDGSFFHVGHFAPSNTEMRSISGFLFYSPIPDEMARFDIRLGLVFTTADREIVLGRFPRSVEGYVGRTAAAAAMRIYNHYYPAVQYAVERDPVRVHLSTPGRREIRTFDADGRLIRILRQRIPLEPLTDEAIDAEREEVADSADRRGVNVGDITALFDQIVFPDSVFPYSRLIADRSGNLWVETHALEPDSSVATYQVFDPRGAWLGPVRIPRAIGTPEEIGEDYLLTIRTDEFDVPYLRLHRLVKDGGR